MLISRRITIHDTCSPALGADAMDVDIVRAAFETRVGVSWRDCAFGGGTTAGRRQRPAPASAPVDLKKSPPVAWSLPDSFCGM